MSRGSLFLLTAVGVLQCGANGYALASDYLWYFSQTKMVVDFIPDNENVLIAADNDFMATSMTLWRPKAKYYSRLGGGRRFTYVRWDQDGQIKKIPRDVLLAGLCYKTKENPKLSLYYVDSNPDYVGGFPLQKIFISPPMAPTAALSERFKFFKVDCNSGPLDSAWLHLLATKKVPRDRYEEMD